ncbi:MAG: exodeoxyribonuclease VII large subunit [Gammaproteobacteria bacterium]|nr:exodeoxyribonuclease VII large subunit [Gammaproteobacteria bacterium]
MGTRLGTARDVGGDGRDVFSVSRLNETARALLETGLGNVWVEGEVSNLARPASGHVYFSLKDASAQVRCAMFRTRNRAVGFEARDGMKVVAYGRVSLYTPRGDYQLIVEALEAAGEGLLRMRFEQLKRKLFEEGLFDAERKRPLPRWPRAVGVVTSASGAAVRDIITVLKRRCPALPVIIYPTSVQGEGAAAEIAAAIATANRRAECDVLLVGRGGGSLEDLWSFNEEIVARAIHASAIPVVSAVGHEVDFTIADLVADLRAATPSAAAELVSPDMLEIEAQVERARQRLVKTVSQNLKQHTRELEQLRRRLISPQRRLELHFQRLDELLARLPTALTTQLSLKRSQLRALEARVASQSPRARIAAHQGTLEHARHRLTAAMRRLLEQRQARLARCEQVLRALGPGATLERGYAIVTDASGRLLRDARDVELGATLTTRLARGRLEAEVTHRELASEGDDSPPQS